MAEDFFKYLVSPKTGLPLKEINGKLVTEDKKECFAIRYGVANLLDKDCLGVEGQHEADVFNGMEIQNVSYFRRSLFERIERHIDSFLSETLKCRKDYFLIVELGGGEGHWARFMQEKFPEATVFVCDLSHKTLERAPGTLRRVCADITRPIFNKDSISLASFWVSLHHLGKNSRYKALEEVVSFLVEDGILLIFEPNEKFWPRQVMYKSRLSRDVYPDEQEQAVDFSDMATMAESLGLTNIATCFLNPPYNPKFIKKLKKWIFYLFVVEFLYIFDRWIMEPLLGGLLINNRWYLKKYFTLYGLSVYKKKRLIPNG